MAAPAMNRRQFNARFAAGLLLAGLPGLARPAVMAATRLRVAAIQMTPKIGDAAANLRQAETLALDALRKGAQWVILPELFSSGAAFHPDMLKAIRPLDGEPAQLLLRLARQGNAHVGGSFLASRQGRVFNTFLLAHPDGTASRHDKDLPTYWENCYYEGGQDDGVLETPIGQVGSVLCWEFIRSQTARRLAGKVRLVVGGSTWWALPDDAPAYSPLRADNLKMLQQAPPRLARLLGVPVVHGSHTGPFSGFFSPSLADVAYDSSFLGEAMIVDAKGHILARRAGEEGAGILLAEIELPARPVPAEPIPDAFWLPPELPEPWKESWQRWLQSGAHYYREVTLPYLKTGEVREYLPEQL
jgi:predicted amidohydrolase